MTDLSDTIAPRSDQLNADDLIAGGPRTITITRVIKLAPGAAIAGDEKDGEGGGKPNHQPTSIYFDGDNGKPYKPCLSMRRVLGALWGLNGADYVGRRLTLYCDPSVRYGGKDVGGIRISHMSHIEQPRTVLLTVTRAKRAPFTVKPLRETNSTAADRSPQAAQDGGGVIHPPSATPPPSVLVSYGGCAFNPAAPRALDLPLPIDLMDEGDWLAWCTAVSALIGAASDNAKRAWIDRNVVSFLKLEALHPAWAAKLKRKASAVLPRAADEGAPATKVDSGAQGPGAPSTQEQGAA